MSASDYLMTTEDDISSNGNLNYGAARSKDTVVDINNLYQYPELDRTDMDLEADAYAIGVPPKPGRYLLALRFYEGSPRLKDITISGVSRQYYSATLEATIVNSEDKDANGAHTYPQVSTIIGRGKRISTMATMIRNGGGTISKKSATQRDVLEDFVNYLKGEPRQWADLDWELTFKNSDGKYKTVYQSYNEFPLDRSTGQKQSVFNLRLTDGTKIKAYPRLVVRRWVGTDPSKATPANGTAAGSPAGSPPPLTARGLASLTGSNTADVVKDLEAKL